MGMAPRQVYCEHVELLYDAYYHNLLPSDVKEAFDTHLHGCECCQMLVGRYATDFDGRWESFFQTEPDLLEGAALSAPAR